MKVALYARVSTEDQAGKDHVSLPAQLRSMRERCAREGWSIVAEFEAPGESAFTDDLARRPVLLAAVEAGERKECDLIMVHESSRFARNAYLALTVRRRLERAGVLLLEAGEHLGPRTAEKGLFATMTAGVNEYWSEKLSEHTRKVKREMFAQGLHVGDPPFGYRRQGPKMPLAIVPDEAAAVVEGFRDYVAGASYTEILTRWNAAGLRPRSKQGHTRFTVPAMQTIFENDFYAGFVRRKGERQLGAHEAIIPEELWLAAQSRPKHRDSRSPRRRMLSGIAGCVACRGPVWVTSHGRPSKPTYYYREPSLERGRLCANQKTYWRVEPVEEAMDRVMRSMTSDAAFIKRVSRAARSAPSTRDDEERARLLASKRRATTAYLDGALEEGEWRQRVGEIDGALSALGSPEPMAVEFAGEKLATVGQLWEWASVEEQREACRILFEGVLLDTRHQRMWLKPWAEFRAYFSARRDEVVSLVGPPGGELTQLTTRGLYLASELVA